MSELYNSVAPAGGRIAELVELAKQTTCRLGILWDEVGYTPQEKDRQMEGLIDGFRTLCENKVGICCHPLASGVGVAIVIGIHMSVVSGLRMIATTHLESCSLRPTFACSRVYVSIVIVSHKSMLVM